MTMVMMILDDVHEQDSNLHRPLRNHDDDDDDNMPWGAEDAELMLLLLVLQLFAGPIKDVLRMMLASLRGVQMMLAVGKQR